MAHFSVPNRSDRISPAEYGRWIVRWAHENALASVKLLEDGAFQSSTLVQAIRAKSYGAYLQFVAIDMAAYWFHCSEFLRVPTKVQDEMVVGLNKGLSEMRMDNGAAPHASVIQFLRAAMSHYMKANIEDFVSSQVDGPDVYNPDITAGAKVFFELLPRLYPDQKNISDVERLLLGHFVADMPFTIYKSLKDVIVYSD